MTNIPSKSICVFCGSSFGSKATFAENAKQLGEALALKQWGLIYGGGSTGIMGTVARATTSKGGYVHGVIPVAYVSRERTEGISKADLEDRIQELIEDKVEYTTLPTTSEYGETTLVKDVQMRLRVMGEKADAFVALPGGFGTLDELMEVVTWAQLKIHNKPIIIYNSDGFYDNLLKFIGDTIETGFVSPESGKIILIAETVEEVLKYIEESYHS